MIVIATIASWATAPAAHAGAWDCKSSAYACTPGYNASNTAGTWAWSHYGGQWAQTANGLHNCTLYAAWRLQQNGMGDPGNWGDASQWASHTAGNNTPAIGSIAWWGGGDNGHVAYVDDISGSQVHIVADNWVAAGGYTSSGWIAASSVPKFLHPHDVGGWGEGSFVSHGGYVYRIAGGAPVYVSNWASVGGPQQATALSDAQFAALPRYPKNGTLLEASGGGVFVAAGGAPIYLSSYSAIGGPRAGIRVDQAAVDNAGNGGEPWNHLRAYPEDGTLLEASGGGVFIAAGGAPMYLSSYDVIGGARPGVRIDQWAVDHPENPAAHLRPYPADGTLLGASGGGVFIAAGGAPIYLSSWDVIGGPKPVVSVDQWDIDHPENPAAHLRSYPADGTLLGASGGGVFIAAGGAPVYLSSWDVIGGPKPVVSIDQWAIDHTEHPAAHLRPYPVDGTLLEASGGGVFIAAGGAPVYLSSYDAIGGQRPGVRVDQWAIDHPDNPAAHLRPYPVDGTFLNSHTGHVYRVAGGAPFGVSSWSLFGGMQPFITVDQWSIDHAGDPAAHLLGKPVDNTLVEGLPSHASWSFVNGIPSAASSGDSAVGVDDLAIAALLPAPTPQPTATASPQPTATPSATPSTTAAPTQPPTAESGDVGFTINDEAIYTNNRQVTLRVKAPLHATALAVSNDGGFRKPTSLPVPAGGTVPWTLASSGLERLPKTVYLRFKGSGVDPTQSFSDDIILDETPPAVARASVSAIAQRSSSLRTVTVSASDNASGLASLRLKTGGKPTVPRPFARRFPYRGSIARLRIQVRDGAGNWSKWRAVHVH